VITGMSGSGKSTLAFDILSRRATKISRRMSRMRGSSSNNFEKPDVDLVEGLPERAIEQRDDARRRQSNVATVTKFIISAALVAKTGTILSRLQFAGRKTKRRCNVKQVEAAAKRGRSRFSRRS